MSKSTNFNLENKVAKNKFLSSSVIGIIVILIGYFSIYRPYTGQSTLDTASAFLFMLLALAIGEFVSTKTKAFIPSIFVSATLFIIGFWTFFPKDILQVGGISPAMPGFLVMMMVTNLGTMLDIDELIAQWKTVIITLVGMAGIILAVMTIGALLLGNETAAVAAPPLTGGLVSAIMMQELVADNEKLSILAMAMYVLQGFVGFPLTNICLKIEAKNYLKRYRAGDIAVQNIKGKEKNSKLNIFPQTPKQYQTDYMILLKTVVLVVLSGYLEAFTNGAVSKYVFALLLGVFGAEIGFIERKPLERSRSVGLFLTIIMMYVLSGLNSITIPVLLDLLGNFIILISLATIGIAILCMPVGKKLGLSKAMSFAIGLGTLAGGFPASYVLSDEAAKVLSENDDEYKVLLDHLLPKTLVAGFVSATSGSVIVAGIFASLFFK
jgi:hypothetical protein